MKLVKAALAAILLAAGFATASAQRYYEPKFYIGFKGGATLSRVSFTPHVKQSLLPGVQMGLTARYTEEKVFGIIAELLLNQRGWKENYEGAPFAYQRSLTYITLPVLTHIYFGGPRLKGFVNLGASVSYMLSSKIKSDFNYADALGQPGFPAHRSVEQMALPIDTKFDYGILGGVGFEVVVARKHSLLVEGRYYFGLGSIFDTSKKGIFSASRNTSIDISLAYLFRLK